MASYEEVVTVTISLDTTVIDRTGFGVPIFIGAHSWFTERVKAYSSITEAKLDLPETSDEFKAVNSAFSQDPKVPVVKVGRKEVDLVTLTPSAATAVGQIFNVTVKGTDGVEVAASFTSTTGSETATAIATALDTGLAGVVGVTVVDATGSITLAKSGTDPFAITSISDSLITTDNTTTETAATTYAAIVAEDNDFYFVATNDKSEAYVMLMASVIESTEKVYFVSTNDVESIATLSVPAAINDVIGKIFDAGYSRTSCWYHQDAETTFPEMAAIALGAPYDAGTVTWANNLISGFSASQDTATSLNLSTTQKGNLTARNASFIERTGGQNVSSAQSGKVASGEWVDVIRNRDFLVARITEAYQSFFIGSPIVPYTDSGINRVKGVLSSELAKYVETDTQPNILELANPFTLSFPRSSEVSATDKAARLYQASFSAFLSGAIQVTKITGTLSYNLG